MNFLRRALTVGLISLSACSSAEPIDPFAMGRADAGFTDVPRFDVHRAEVFVTDRGPTPELVDLTDVSLFRDVSSDATCDATLDGTLVFTSLGGRAASRDTVTLGAPRRFLFERTFTDASPLRCETTLVGCASMGVDARTVSAALSDPEVQAAFTRAPVLYGVDSRPSDGTVLSLRRGSAEVLVGDPCRTGGGADCVSAPPGVQRLVDVLNALKDQETLREPCRTALGLDGGA